MILEHEHYGASRNRGAWGDGSLLLKAVEEYHASYLSIHWWPHEFLKENKAVIDRINRRLGYRLQLRELTWPREATIGHSFTVRSRWANAGVAPCYTGGFPALTLKDSKGGIVAVLVDDTFDLRTLAPHPDSEERGLAERVVELTAGLIAPATKAGTYDVFISVGLHDGTPRIALPLLNNDGQRRYRLGVMRLVDESPRRS